MDLLAPLVVVTTAAREKILEIRAREPEPDALALWLEVSGVRNAAYTYDMYFQRLDEAGPDDSMQRDSDVSVLGPQASAGKGRGAILDAVPELTGVVDVTDHATGTNPFFESAKG